jgi:hypothetical protein
MSNVGIGLYVRNQVLLTHGTRQLTLDFNDAEVCRLIVMEPAVRQVLPKIMVEQQRHRMTWADLRLLLEAEGLDIRALIADNPAEPKPALVSRTTDEFGRQSRWAL